MPNCDECLNYKPKDEGRGWQEKDDKKCKSVSPTGKDCILEAGHVGMHESIADRSRRYYDEWDDEPQYVLLSDLVEEFGEERVREWFRKNKVWSDDVEKFDGLFWIKGIAKTYDCKDLHLYKATTSTADEFRREMNAQKPQAQDCILCGSKARTMKYTEDVAQCTEENCQLGGRVWYTLKFWNRLRLATEK